MSLVYESMPISSLFSLISNLSLSSTAQSSGMPSVTSSAPTPVPSVSNNSMVTVTASSFSSSGKYSNSSSASSGKTSTVSSSKPATGMIVSTADFTSGQSLPTSLVLATSYANSTGQSQVPISTYTSWAVVGGNGNGSSSVMGVGGTGLASPQDRPSRAARGGRRTNPSSLALGVLVLVLVLIA